MGLNRDSLLKGMETKRILFGLFFAFGNRLQTAGDSFYKEITCKQFFLLICLSLFKEMPPTINELSEVMGSSHQNVKQIINKLEKAGFVITFYDKEDKRKLRVAATEKMSKISERSKAQEMEFMERLFEGVSEEDAAITLKVMNRIENNLIKIKENNGQQRDGDCAVYKVSQF